VSVVSVTATVEASNVPPRVRLDVVDNGSPFYYQTTVTRLNPDGTTSPVRTQDGNPLPLTTSGSNRVGLLYDYEPQFGAQVSYSTLETPGTVAGPVVVPEDRIWLIHPAIPSLSIPVTLAPGSLTQISRAAKRGVFYPMGRQNPVVQTDGARKGVESTLNVLTMNTADLAALRALLQDTGVLLLNIPTDRDYGFPTCYIAVGDVSEARSVDRLPAPYRVTSLPFVVVDRPAGGSQAQRTLADLFEYATLADLMTAYPTFADLLAGP
jgi:hypothetical protein